MNAGIVEYVHGIEVIKAYSQSRSSFQKFKDKVLANASFYNYWMKKTEVCQALCYTIAPCTLITVLPVGWHMYVSGSISADVFMTSIMLSICIVGGFWDVTDGSVKMDGKDLRSIPLEQLYDQVAYVSQDNWLFDDTIMNNIRMGKTSASDDEVRAAAKASGCDEFISALPQGYETEVGNGGTRLSGGERQRIAIARAMLKDAPIVILDEATANVDPENEDKLIAAFDALTENKTVIMIAHRLKTIRNADRIVVLDGGSISCGTHDELMESNGKYSRFIRLREEAACWKMKSA